MDPERPAFARGRGFALPESSEAERSKVHVLLREHQILAAQTFVQRRGRARMVMDEELQRMTLAPTDRGCMQSTLVASPCGSGKTLILAYVMTLLDAYVEKRGTRVLVLVRNSRDARSFIHAHPTGLRQMQLHPHVQVVSTEEAMTTVDNTKPILVVAPFRRLPRRSYYENQTTDSPSTTWVDLAGTWDAVLVDEAHQLGARDSSEVDADEAKSLDGLNYRMEGVCLQIRGWDRSSGSMRSIEHAAPTLMLTGSPFRHGDESKMEEIAAIVGITKRHVLNMAQSFPPLYGHEDPDRRARLELQRETFRFEFGAYGPTGPTTARRRFETLLYQEAAATEDSSPRLRLSNRPTHDTSSARTIQAISHIVDVVTPCPIGPSEWGDIQHTAPRTVGVTCFNAVRIATSLTETALLEIRSELWREAERVALRPLTFREAAHYDAFYDRIQQLGGFIKADLEGMDDEWEGSIPEALSSGTRDALWHATHAFHSRLCLGTTQVRNALVVHTSVACARLIASYLGHDFESSSPSPVDSEGCQQVEYVDGTDHTREDWFRHVLARFERPSATDRVAGTAEQLVEYIRREACNANPTLRARVLDRLRARGAAGRLERGAREGMTLGEFERFSELYGARALCERLNTEFRHDPRIPHAVTTTTVLQELRTAAAGDPQCECTSADARRSYRFWSGEEARRRSEEADVRWSVLMTLETAPAPPQLRVLVGTDVLDEALDLRATLLVSAGGSGPSVTQEVQRRGRIQRPERAIEYHVHRHDDDSRTPATVEDQLRRRRIPSFDSMAAAAAYLQEHGGDRLFEYDIRVDAPTARAVDLVGQWTDACMDPSKHRPLDTSETFPDPQSAEETGVDDTPVVRPEWVRACTERNFQRVEDRLAAMREWNGSDAVAGDRVPPLRWTEVGDVVNSPLCPLRLLHATSGDSVDAFRMRRRAWIHATQSSQPSAPAVACAEASFQRWLSVSPPSPSRIEVVRAVLQRGVWYGIGRERLVSHVRAAWGGVSRFPRRRPATQSSIRAHPSAFRGCGSLEEVRRYLRAFERHRPCGIDPRGRRASISSLESRGGNPPTCAIALRTDVRYRHTRGWEEGVVVELDRLACFTAPLWLGRAVVRVENDVYAMRESFVYEVRGADECSCERIAGESLAVWIVGGDRYVRPDGRPLQHVVAVLESGVMPSSQVGVELRSENGQCQGIVVQTRVNSWRFEAIVQCLAGRPFASGDLLRGSLSTDHTLRVERSVPHEPRAELDYWCAYDLHRYVPSTGDQVQVRSKARSAQTSLGYVLGRSLATSSASTLRSREVRGGPEWSHTHAFATPTVARPSRHYDHLTMVDRSIDPDRPYLPLETWCAAWNDPSRTVYQIRDGRVSVEDRIGAETRLQRQGGVLAVGDQPSSARICRHSIVPPRTSSRDTVDAAIELAAIMAHAAGRGEAVSVLWLSPDAVTTAVVCLTSLPLYDARGRLSTVPNPTRSSVVDSVSEKDRTSTIRSVIASIPFAHETGVVSDASLFRCISRMDLTCAPETKPETEFEKTRACLVRAIGGSDAIDSTRVVDASVSRSDAPRADALRKRKRCVLRWNDASATALCKMSRDAQDDARQAHLREMHRAPNELDMKYAVLCRD